ncbi:MAG TPA: MFS transporter [Xanthobacteraceae bacterium]|nr:MFS transporter [Xanthobacteraceae bacterium]
MSDLPVLPPGDVPPPIPRLSPKRILTTVWFAVFATSLFFRAVDPIIPQIAADLNEPVGSVALLATAFALPYALMQPILGALADVMGKTRMMFLCLVLVTIATFAAAFATTLPQLMATRIVAGIVAGGLFPISLALVADTVRVQDRQVAIGRLLAGAMLGNLLGASASGIVTDFIGWRGVFIFNGFAAAAAMIAAFIGFGGPGRKPPTQMDFSQILPSYRAIFSNPMAKFCFGGVFIEGVFLLGMYPFVAPLLHDQGETRASIAGIVIAGFGVGGIIYSIIIGTLLPRFGQRRLMIVGGILQGAGIMAMALQPSWQAQLAIFVMFGCAFYLLHGSIQIFVTELAPSARSSAAAAHSTFFFTGQSIGPLFYRYGFAEVGLVPSLLFGGVMLMINGIICATFLRQRPR